MIEKRTVFILGAGASRPYKFPTAEEFGRAILKGLPGWYGIFYDQEARHVVEGYPEISFMSEFLNKFRSSNTASIDLFLSRWPKFATIGKIAILLGILQHEKESCFRDNVTEAHPDGDWYSCVYEKLTKDLTESEGLKKFGENKVAFITFNYDRSLEHFLFESLLNSFEGANAESVREQIDAVPIIHIYGKLASLPWQQDDPSRGLRYGDCDSLSSCNALSMTKNLYVIHEERMNPELEKARTAISEAERIFFLGFGYAKENLDVLGFPGVLRPVHHIYGTAVGFNAEEVEDKKRYFVRELVHSDINSPLAGYQVKIDNCDCVQLLRKFP